MQSAIAVGKAIALGFAWLLLIIFFMEGEIFSDMDEW